MELVEQAVTGLQLNINNVGKAFGERQVLKDINLSIAPGEFVAVVGQSGCGKSTLLRLIAGLDKPTQGELQSDGSPLNSDNVRLMFQDARLLPWKRVLDNVGLGLPNRPVSEQREAAHEALKRVGLLLREGDWPRTLSGGERQRVALARLLVSNPRLLLLDEPLGALDALTRLEMQELIEELWRRQGFTALLVTHDVEEAVALADRVILIKNGEITLNLPIALDRPRQRGNLAFVEYKESILRQVLHGDQTANPITINQPAIDQLSMAV